MNRYIQVLIVIFISIIFFSKCKRNDEIPFNQEKWIDNEYSYDLTREKMVGDLIDNYLDKSLCYNDLTDLLGPTAKPNNKEPFHLYFQLQEVRASDAEFLWVTYLDITINKDSCYQSGRILKLRL